jgi:uncharacterized protein YwqG
MVEMKVDVARMLRKTDDLIDAAFPHDSARVGSRVRHALRLGIESALETRSRRSDAALSTSASKWGGVPDLPVACEAPALPLVCQINLSFLPVWATPFLALEGLPSSGLLSFFFDTSAEQNARSNGRVIYTPSSESLVRRIGHPDAGLEVGGMTFAPEVTLPEPRTVSFDGLVAGDALPRYRTLRDDLSVQTGRTGWWSADRFRKKGKWIRILARHRLGGYDDPIQGDMATQCELASRGVEKPTQADFDAHAKNAHDWRLLLQVDTDERDVGSSFWSYGTLYYWIRERDLRRRHFDDVHAFIQAT